MHFIRQLTRFFTFGILLISYSITVQAQSFNFVQTQPSKNAAPPLVIDSMHNSPEDILRMLKRAEQLSQSADLEQRPSAITLILHGNEIENFRISQYETNKEMVDLAAKLDAFEVLDVRMCNTMMNHLKVPQNDIPAFIEIVPYAPATLNSLMDAGYIRL